MIHITQSKSLSLPQNRRIHSIKSLSFHPTHPYITLSSRKSLHTFCLRSGARVSELNTESEVLFVKYHAVSELLVVAHRNGSLACYEMKEHPVSLLRLRNFHESPNPNSSSDFIAHLVPSKLRDGLVYLSRFKSSTVRCLDLFSGRKISDMSHKKIVTCLEVSMEYGKEYVVTGCIDGSVRLWENGQVVRHQFDAWGEKHKGRNPVSALCVGNVASPRAQSVPSTPRSRGSTSSISLGAASGTGALSSSSTSGGHSMANSSSLLAVATQYGMVQLWQVDYSIFVSSCIGKISLNRWITSLQFHPTLPILFALTDKGVLIPIWIGDALSKSGVSKGETTELFAFDMMDPLYASVNDPDYAPSSSGNKQLSKTSIYDNYSKNKYAAYCLPSIRFEIDPHSLQIALYGKSFQLTPYASISSNYQNYGCDIFPLFSLQDLSFPLCALPICSNHSTQMDLFLGMNDASGSPSAGAASTDGGGGGIEYKFPFSDVYYVDTVSEAPNAVLMSKTITEDGLVGMQTLNSSTKQKRGHSSAEFHQCVHASFSPSCQHAIMFYKVLRQKQHNMNQIEAATRARSSSVSSPPRLSPQSLSNSEATFCWKYLHVGRGDTPLQYNGIDGTFIGESEFVILSENGQTVTRFQNNQIVDTYEILPTATQNSVEEAGGCTPLQSNEFSFDDLSNQSSSQRKPQKSVHVTRLFSCPYNQSLLLYFDEESNTLGLAHPPNDSRQFQYDLSLPFIHMKLNEKVLSVVWQCDTMCSGEHTSSASSSVPPVMIGILTSHRIMITTQDMEIISQVEILNPNKTTGNTEYVYKHKFGSSANMSKSIPYTYHSCLWVANTLLFNNDEAVYALIAGRNEPTYVCSLDHEKAVLAAVFPDRLVLISYHPSGERICTRYLNVGDILLEGIMELARKTQPKSDPSAPSRDIAARRPSLTRGMSHVTISSNMNSTYKSHSEGQITHMIKMVLERFDCRQIPEWAIRRMLDQGYGKVCSKLQLVTVNEYQWHTEFQIALDNGRLEHAFRTLLHQFLSEYMEDEFVPESSQYHSYFNQLAQKAQEEKQNKLAARCLFMLQDVWGLFNLFANMNLRRGLIYLSCVTQNSTDLYSIHVACETLLAAQAATSNENEEDVRQEIASSAESRTSFERVVLDYITDEAAAQEAVNSPHTFAVVATELQGKILTKKKNVSPSDSSASLDQMSTNSIQYDQLDALKHNSDIATWLGFHHVGAERTGLSMADDSSQGWGSQNTFDFQRSFDYNASDTASHVSTSEMSSDEMSSAHHRAGSSVAAGNEEASETESVAESERSSTGAADTSLDQDALRQKYLGGGSDDSSSSDSEFSDSDDDRGYNTFKKKKKLFKSVRISDTSVVSPDGAAPKTLNFGGATNSRPGRRRRIGGSNNSTTSKNGVGSNNTASVADQTSNGSVARRRPKVSKKQAAFEAITSSLTAAECFKKCTESVNSHSYAKAEKYAIASIQKLVDDPQQVLSKKHILLCVQYLLFTRIAIKLAQLFKQKAPIEERAAVAACLWPASERLTPQHLCFCRNQCYKMNMQAHNYAFAAIVIRSFVNKTPPKFRPTLERGLEECTKHGLSNENEVLPAKEGDPFVFDWRTLEILKPDEKHYNCDYCKAIYKEERNSEDGENKCDFCFHGNVQ